MTGRSGQDLGDVWRTLTSYRRLLLAPPARSRAATLEPMIARRTITFLYTANPPQSLGNSRRRN